jgi:NTE family protein
MASSSIWCLYPTTPVGERWYWDGALLANTPIQPAIDLILAREEGAPTLDVVVVSMTPHFEGPPGLETGDPPSVLDGLARFLDWMMLGTLRGQLARLSEAQRKQVRIISPDRFQGVVQIIDYHRREIEALRRQGKADALAKLEETEA